jgi:HSP20 family protein
MFSLVPWTRDRNGAAPAPRTEHPFDLVRQSFDTLFDRAFGDWGALTGGASRWSALHGLDPYGFELRETDREIYCSLDAPGFEAGDFDVQVCGNSVKISAAAENNENGRSSRRMQKYVELPVEIEPDHVEAQYRNGVLELKFQKAEHAQWRKIDVKSS